MADVVCLGEVLIDFVPTVTPNTLIEAGAFKKAPGGAPANVAVGLARLGVPSAFMGKVGDDPFGQFLIQTLAEAGVDVGPVRFSSEARTALAFVSLRADGDREFMFYRHPSADMLFEPAEVDAEAIRGARLLHYGTISLISEPSRSATLHAIELARDAGCIVSCDPNLRLALWPDREAARAGLRAAIAQTQVLKLSDEELRFLTGSDDPAAARELLWHEGLELMVVTMGGAGCVYFTPDHDGVVVGFGVEAVDTTGAGDGFVAGLLHGLLADWNGRREETRVRAICRTANAVGALATTERGAIPALPTLERVRRFLDGHPNA
ncbi:MAG: PfkB family carbohydrate kinase [Geminicoccaceae bacterium]|nr:PfkB family carbohydrate kinase [Geminicoccaceae bacterium]